MANSEIGRFINKKVAAATLAGTIALAGCGGDTKPSFASNQAPSASPNGEVSNIDYDKLAESIAKAIKKDGAQPDATIAPVVVTPEEPDEVTAENEVKVGSVSFIGTPDSVDPKNVDKSDHKPFSHKIGLGSEMVLGEPGGLLVGPDFGFTGRENPYGANPGGWNTMYESEGHINPFSPVTQEVLRYAGPAYQNLPEGGFMMASAGQMDVRIGDFEIKMPSLPNNNYLLFVRGKFGDMEQNTDGNMTVEITNYQPGHALVGMYESGDNAGTAFVSEGQFIQMAETSHSGGTNKGDGGASSLTAVFFDVNTRAYTVLQQELGRNQDASGNWDLVGSNWFTR